MKRVIVVAIASLLFVVAVGGCDAPAAMEASVEQDAYAQIEGLGDAAGDEEMFADAFTAGSVPENRKDYAERGYQIAAEATVEGNTATVPVKIFGGISATSDSDRGGSGSSSISETEQVWTLELVGEDWKIKDAPLG